jgi:hypothetical protein
VVDRVLQRLRTRGESMTRRELNADPVVGGSVEGIRKALERLIDRGLVTSEGKASYRRYQAVTARRGVGLKGVHSEEEGSAGTGSDDSRCPEVSETVRGLSFFGASDDPGHPSAQKRTRPDKQGQSDCSDPLHRNVSDENGQDTSGLFTRERSKSELDDLIRTAADTWS